uniref:Uncharacterized protein n=1 Tax=Streptomyces sp. NBC_00049 TaxID=2903617 RepID=A0AAU2JK56_9ACTN
MSGHREKPTGADAVGARRILRFYQDHMYEPLTTQEVAAATGHTLDDDRVFSRRRHLARKLADAQGLYLLHSHRDVDGRWISLLIDWDDERGLAENGRRMAVGYVRQWAAQSLRLSRRLAQHGAVPEDRERAAYDVEVLTMLLGLYDTEDEIRGFDEGEAV